MELTQTDEATLKLIMQYDGAVDALRKVFSEAFEPRIPILVNGISNEDIGAHFRAHEEAKRLVDTAFYRLAQFTKQEITNLKLNPAR